MNKTSLSSSSLDAVEPSKPSERLNTQSNDTKPDHNDYPRYLPPVTDARVLSTTFLFNDVTEYLSFGIDGLLEQAECGGEIWIYIPESAKITAVSLIMWGFKSLGHIKANIDQRNEWQCISIAAEIPPGKIRALLRLCVSGTGQSELFFCAPSIKVVTKLNSSKTIAKETRVYEAITLQRIYEDAAFRESLGITISKEFDDVVVPIVPISFGQIEQPDFQIVQHPSNSWNDAKFQLSNRYNTSIPEAIIHTDEGLVTFGPYFVKDSILLLNQKNFDAAWVGHDRLRFSLSPTKSYVETGSYLFFGYPGNRNYAHWVVDILPNLPISSASDFYNNSIMLMPEVLGRWQKGYMDLVPEIKNSIVGIGRTSAIQCETLRINSHSMSNSAHFPHPERLQIMEAFKDRARKQSKVIGRRVYLSRGDTSARSLINEPELIELMRRYGFDIVLTSKLSVADQITTFATAEFIVGGHGAGLANVIFCKPQTPFLELLTDTYVQWSMRRLASLVPLRYGCVIGREIGSSKVQQLKTWSIDLQLVKKALSEVL